MVARVQGSGNCVRAGNDRASVYSMFRLERVDGGGLPTARIVAVDRVAKDPALPPFGTAPDGHRIRRLRYLSGDLAAVEEIWLDGSHAARIAPEDLSESLYLYYRERLNLWIVRAEDSIGQAPLPNWTPAEFPHPAGTPMPHITRLVRLRDGSCAEAS